MTTNFKKLVGWSVDEYNALSDDGCLVCLTQRERYILGQMTRQLVWLTRWDNPSNLQLPDLEQLKGGLDYKMSDQGCIDLCQVIIDCIEDPQSGVSDAISNIVAGNTYIDSRNYGQSQSGKDLAGGNNPECDFDAWFGGIMELVDSANQNNVDALQILEVATNLNEWIGQVAGGIFGIEAPVAQSIADWALFIQQSILENYEAEITQEYLETLYCDLWCIATENCELTPEQITNYFFERLSSQLTFESLLNETLTFLFAGIWTGTEIADVMFLSQFAFRAQLGRWFDFIGFNSINLDLALGFNNPDSDWELLCDECPRPWTVEYLDGSGDPALDGWVANFGTYNSGNDWYDGTTQTSSSKGVQLEYEVPIGIEFVLSAWTFRYSVATWSNRTQRVIVFDENDNVLVDDTVVVSGSNTGTVSLQNPITILGEYRLIAQASASIPPDSTCRITAIEINGDGDNPFE